eukprot:jgi/Tetstr1/432628/TSEL_021997.t1
MATSVRGSAAVLLAGLLLPALLASAAGRALQGPDVNDYRAALKGVTWNDTVSMCETVIGYPQLFILWNKSSSRNAKAFLNELEKTDGVTIMEVHRMHFPQSEQGFADCHMNFYTNNNCGIQPSYSKTFLSREYLARTKGVGPFKVVLFSFDCSDTHSQGLTNLWRGIYSDYLRLLKAALRQKYATGTKFTIHGTMSRAEAEIDIESLFGAGYYDELTQKAKGGLQWNGKIIEHDRTICPETRKQPCVDALAKEVEL